MSFTALKKRFIPLGSWSPDTPEFAPGFLDQIVNVIPVFGVYRTLQRMVILSVCPEERRVTGTFVHRISVDQTLDIMQPDYTEPANTPGLPFSGFQAVPGLINGVSQEFWQALRGLNADAATTVLFIASNEEKTLYGTFSKPNRVWNNTDDLVASFQYRIASGFTGAYSFTVEIGIVGDENNPEEPTGFTALDDFTKTGTLQADGNDEFVIETIEIPNASIADPGDAERYAFRFIQEIETDEETNQVALNPTQARSASATGDPNSLFGWRNEAGSSAAAAVVPSIAGLVAGVWPAPPTGDDTFAVSDELWSTSTTGGIGFFFRPAFPQFVNLNGHKIKVRFSVENLTQKVSVGIYQGINRFPGEGILIRPWLDLFASAVYPAIAEWTLDDATQQELQAISNWDDVWILFFAKPPTATGSVNTLTFRPIDQYQEVGDWTPLPGGTEIGNLSDNNNGTGIRQPSLSVTPNPQFSVHIAPFTGPRQSVARLFAYVLMGNSGAGQTNVQVFLLDQSSNPARGYSESFVIGGALTQYGFNAPLSNFPSLANLKIEIRVTGAGSSQFLDVADVWVEMETGVSSRARLHGFAYFGPEDETGAGAPIDVSWLRLDGPAEVSDIQSDTLKAYIGTVDEPDAAAQVGKIYEVSSPNFSEWNDVSNTSTPYSSNARDKSWSFCNFGSIVIATNYADEVQALYDGESEFIDMIGFDTAGVAIAGYGAAGGVEPRARYAATIGAFFCLANCDPLSVPGTATPYSFWCSRYAQPQYFHIGLAEWQSSVFQLVSTPGEITGLVGGLEYGFVFKENSVLRMDYVGLPEIFSPTQISGEQGTVQPRSIVRVDNDVYFWGIGGIYVIREGRQLEEVADQGSVRKFIFDSQFEAFSISPHTPSLESEASVKVVGGYDNATGCIFWSFQSKRHPSEWFKCDSALVYSPRENRFSFLHGDMISPSFPTDRILTAADLFNGNSLQTSGYLSLGNRQTSGQSYLMKTIFAVRGIPPEIVSFSGNPVYEQIYRSNTVVGSSFGAPIGVEIEIHKIRAILAIENTAKPPRYQVWIEANQSPAVGDGTGRVVTVESAQVNREGWIDLGTPISGEFFKFSLAFAEYTEPIVKEVHGWQVVYRVAGDR